MVNLELCMRVLRAESEEQVKNIVELEPALADKSNWHPIDGRNTNFNVVTNQASTGSKALTELCTNMVDAVLMKHAYVRGVDLTGKTAPSSVIAGVRDLVKLPGARSGILAQVDDESYLRKFAEKNLVIGVTGGTRRDQSLCFTFVDNGEGQHPSDFEETFLSLSKGNKSDIPFVQGKYNMGSSGVLTYCGRRWYKLIVSRRHDGSGDWGWTLVRRRPGDGMPVAEYFMPGRIPSFAARELYPMHLSGGEPDAKIRLSTGTVVKLYDYNLESAASFRNIREALNENLVSTVLPFRLMDYRYPPDPRRGGRRALGVDERPLNGMEFLLLRRDGEDTGEERVYEPGNKQFIGDLEHPDLGHISVQAIVLGRQLPGWLQSPRNTSRVFHAVNGQVQFKQNRGYLSQRCRFPGLKDRIVVIVDASDLTEAAHNDVWKGDRETIRRTVIGQLYDAEVTGLVRNSEYLKELQHRFAKEETERISEESQVELFQSLIDSDPSIAQLLPGGSVVSLPGYVGRNGKETEDWHGKYSPTFLKLVGKSVRQDGAEIAIDGRRRVAFRTDVVNDYFTRPENRGRVFTSGLDGKLSYTSSLRDGRLTINFASQPDRVQVGDTISLSLSLLDDAMPEPVTEELAIKIVDTRTPRRSGPPTPPGPNVNDEEETVHGRDLPPSKWLTKDGRMVGDEESAVWPDDFTDQDGGKVEDLGEVSVYSINYDNAHFRRFLDQERDDINKKVVSEQYRIGMLVLMMGLDDAYSRMEQTELKTELEEHIDEIRRLAAKGAATVVMSIAKTLPSIINPAAIADPDD